MLVADAVGRRQHFAGETAGLFNHGIRQRLVDLVEPSALAQGVELNQVFQNKVGIGGGVLIGHGLLLFCQCQASGAPRK